MGFQERIDEMRQYYRQRYKAFKEQLEKDKQNNAVLSKISIDKFKAIQINPKVVLITKHNYADTCRDPDIIRTNVEKFNTLEEALQKVESDSLQAWEFDEDNKVLTNYEFRSYGGSFTIMNVD